jgi:hypothetical protein
MVRIPVIHLHIPGGGVIRRLEDGADITKAVIELLDEHELGVGDIIVIFEEVEDSDEH